jgi:hypothetical protein
VTAYRIFLDDERFPVEDGWVICRSVAEAIAVVEARGCPSYVCFDNDLGEGGEGWRFAQYLIDRDIDHGDMPEDFDFYIQSQNCVRRDDIAGRLRRYLDYREEPGNDHVRR